MTESENPERMQRADHDTLIRVETLLTTLIETIRSQGVEATTRFTDHETRIRLIENQTNTDRAASRASARTWAVVGAIGGAVMSFVASAYAVASGLIHGQH